MNAYEYYMNINIYKRRLQETKGKIKCRQRQCLTIPTFSIFIFYSRMHSFNAFFIIDKIIKIFLIIR